ncbi:MAG: phage tail sheath subtilisin-like domain-containing protein [bacterium]|nr:phage tail sheath subtilisin-like domain-containing protein [bacterium]
MSISFDNIPTTLRVPWCYIEFDNSRAVQGDADQPYTVLLVGQKLSGGSAPADTPVMITSEAQAKALFGAGSMLSMIVNAFRKTDSFTETWALPLEDDANGVAATGTLAFTGECTAAGTLTLYVSGIRFTVGIKAGDAAAAIATAVAAAINAKTELPVSAAAASGSVTVTCKWKGLTGNDIDLRQNYYSDEETPAGVSLNITAMSGGTANPSVENGLAAMGDNVHYNIIVFPYTDGANLRLLDEELDDRWGPLRQLEGLAFTGKRGTVSELGTFGNGNNTQNLCVIHGEGVPNAPFEIAATAAGLASYYGNIDPARPFQTLTLTGILAPEIEERFTLQERNTLLYDGISTWKVDDASEVRAERFITTYKKNGAGADDRSYLDINTPLTLGRLRYSLRNFLLLRYPRHKLSSGDITQFGAGQAIATPDSVKGDIIAWYQRQVVRGLAEDIETFKSGLIVERNANDECRLDILLTPDVVNQLRVFAAKMQFIL